MKITFLGGGNMASALIGGLLKQGFSANEIKVIELLEAGRERLRQDFGVDARASVDEAALDCDVLLLAIKPQQMQEGLAPLAGRLGQQLVISIAAGLRLHDLSLWLGGHTKLVRAMPNTPALIGKGVTGMFAHVSTLLMIVGLPQSPACAGNGGFGVGMPRFPSMERSRAVSSPQTNAPAPRRISMSKSKPVPRMFFPSSPIFVDCAIATSRRCTASGYSARQ